MPHPGAPLVPVVPGQAGDPTHARTARGRKGEPHSRGQESTASRPTDGGQRRWRRTLSLLWAPAPGRLITKRLHLSMPVHPQLITTQESRLNPTKILPGSQIILLLPTLFIHSLIIPPPCDRVGGCGDHEKRSRVVKQGMLVYCFFSPSNSWFLTDPPTSKKNLSNSKITKKLYVNYLTYTPSVLK